MDISLELVNSFISYEPTSGLMTWKKASPEDFQHCKRPDAVCKTWNSRFAGSNALNFKDSRGYLQGTFRGRAVLAHRIAYLIATGVLADEIDHINGDRSDNRLCNLRAVNRRQNAQNQKQHCRNTSGCSGVYWEATRNKWVARLFEPGRSKNLGRFDTYEAAVSARKAAEASAGYHVNHGRLGS